MKIIVDGDNAPGYNIKGIGKLEEKDWVIIYFASNNKHFNNKERQQKIDNDTKCSVEFRLIPSGDCAVDFAIAVDMHELMQGEDIIILISADRHIARIVECAQSRNPNLFIAQAPTIEEAIKRFKLLDSESLMDINKWLVKSYGNRQGTALYKKIDSLYSEKNEAKLARRLKQPAPDFITQIKDRLCRLFTRVKSGRMEIGK